MKITKNTLKQLIKEELSNIVNEKAEMPPAKPSAEPAGKAAPAPEAKMSSDATRTKAALEKNQALQRAFKMVNTRAEFMEVLSLLVQQAAGNDIARNDIALALRGELKKYTGKETE